MQTNSPRYIGKRETPSITEPQISEVQGQEQLGPISALRATQDSKPNSLVLKV
jgi:hypothetical protein